MPNPAHCVIKSMDLFGSVFSGLCIKGHPQAERAILPDDVVYIGHSHFSHRIPVTCWESPFQVGQDAPLNRTVYAYSQWRYHSPVATRIPKLCNKKLACDCGLADACHGDICMLMAAFALPKPTLRLGSAKPFTSAKSNLQLHHGCPFQHRWLALSLRQRL